MTIQQAASPARSTRLRYVTDAQPGYRRVRSRDGLGYLDPEGAPVDDPELLARFNALAIPPAWEDVWICPTPNGHLQATGRDQRGRKQYRYHAEWRRTRDASKFERMVVFAEALPRIRERVERDLALRGLPREKVLAAAVRLLERTGIRVGNEEYARSNGSYGLTTLRDKHVDVGSSHVTFRFPGKSGKTHHIDLRDPQLARIVRRCRDLPGYELFQYLDEHGEPRSIGSGDVNDYLREAAGDDFTAKDFRTWAGTVLAAMAFCGVEPPSTDADGARKVKAAIEQVAAALGNTVAVCRKSYVHPAVVEAYLDGRTIDGVVQRAEGRLAPEEQATLALLRSAQPKRAARGARRVA